MQHFRIKKHMVPSAFFASFRCVASLEMLFNHRLDALRSSQHHPTPSCTQDRTGTVHVSEFRNYGSKRAGTHLNQSSV